MTESITLNHRLCVYLWRKRRIFVSKSNKHNNGTIYIQFFTLNRTAVNVILRLLFFVCKNSWKGNFQELSPLPTDYGYSYAAAFGKLFGTFLLWYPIQKCGFCHIDEHVHILPVLFSVQFGIDNVAWSFLHYQTACVDTYHFMDYILNSLRSCGVPGAKRNHTKNLFICFSCLVNRFWSRFSSQSHSCIS